MASVFATDSAGEKSVINVLRSVNAATTSACDLVMLRLYAETTVIGLMETFLGGSGTGGGSGMDSGTGGGVSGIGSVSGGGIGICTGIGGGM